MPGKKTVKQSSIGNNSNKFELEPIMKFQEIPAEKVRKIYNDSDISISDEELSEIMQFLHTIVKITIKEFLPAED